MFRLRVHRDGERWATAATDSALVVLERHTSGRTTGAVVRAMRVRAATRTAGGRLTMGRGLSLASRQLIQRAYDVLAVEHPSGVRRVAYALFGNQAGRQVKKLGELLTRARKTGAIPWEWISDETRPERLPYVVQDAGDMRDLHRVCPSYDPWRDQPSRVVVWSEKSVGGTLAPVLDRFLVPFQVHHGNTSTTVMYQTARATREDHRALVILYVGDHDPKGLRISEDDIPTRLDTYGAVNVRVRRLALLRADAVRLRHVQDAFKPDDRDVHWYRQRTGLDYGVELEAIPSTDLTCPAMFGPAEA